ncbi:hypothetical protein FXF51_49325 [Nonomuraea sp. PA05]|uniref:hypothetical protein n=1 Tax=Nonomuraea sp. PA05 TaxID=2604466 RepID=UPI0011D63E31|nr:hypothetical protein [Nonomuraea sp. PA05]TYB53463.1 hypothetical protein FXF51_49325 [Nonomuraea sp. PA05]
MSTQLLRQEQKTATWHGPLGWCAAAMAVLATVSALGLVIDERTLLGQSVWLKPFKFAISFGLYAGTLAWMISQAGRWRRTLWWLGTVTVAGFLVPEISAITFQAARGVPSHFNFSTGLDETVFMVMGGAAYLGWLMTFALGVFLVAQRRVDRAMAWAIPLGLVISLAGMSVGYLMTAPTPAQAEDLASGLRLATIGAHSVGAPDGGAAMPVTGWETGAGDLRVAHFVGLHAMQVIPLVAIGLKLACRRVPVLACRRFPVPACRRVPVLGDVRTALVVIAAFGYAGVTALVLWQAQRGQALVQPDGLTVVAVAALVAVVSACVTAVIKFAAGTREVPRQTP